MARAVPPRGPHRFPPASALPARRPLGPTRVVPAPQGRASSGPAGQGPGALGSGHGAGGRGCVRGRAARGAGREGGAGESGGGAPAGCTGRGSAEIQPGRGRPGAGSQSRSLEAERSQLWAGGLRELKGRRPCGCCCYCGYPARCGGPRRFSVSGSAPLGAGAVTVRGWRVCSLGNAPLGRQ